MKFGIISGSHRLSSNSGKVAKLMKGQLEARGIEVFCRDLALEPLPFWNEEVSQPDSPVYRAWAPLAAEIRSCVAYIVISPEWGGMCPPALKNFFLFPTARQMVHKPALLVTVSTGIGGSYPAHELRISSYKNTGVVYLPDQLILRHVQDFLNDFEAQTSDITKALTGRMKHLLAVLIAYSKAFTQVRQDPTVDLNAFPNGM